LGYELRAGSDLHGADDEALRLLIVDDLRVGEEIEDGVGVGVGEVTRDSKKVVQRVGGGSGRPVPGGEDGDLVVDGFDEAVGPDGPLVVRRGGADPQEVGPIPEVGGVVVGGDGDGLARAAGGGGGVVRRVGVGGVGGCRSRVVKDGAAEQAAGDGDGDGEAVL